MQSFKAVSIKQDRFLILCSILYVILPPVIFSMGWIKPLIAVPVSFIFLLLAYKIYNDLCSDSESKLLKVPGRFWLYALLIICVWVAFSGIGGFSFQNGDFLARNPTYRDLCDYSWPVKYDLADQNEAAQKILGSGSVVFAYYFSWWLPPALVSKIFNFGQTGRDLCIYIWAVTGLLLVFYNLCRYLRKASLIALIIFIFFSGLDVIGHILYSNVFFDINALIFPHWEAWNRLWEYSAITTSLFFVFNQAIPIWLIMSLLLQLKRGKNVLALSSLTFAYSPWAAIGIIPIALNAVFPNFKDLKNKLRDMFTLQNILVPLVMMLIYGLFYISSSGAGGYTGFSYLVEKSLPVFILKYIAFIILEFGIYFMIMGSSIKNYKFYYVVLVELILIPLYTVNSTNFQMRGSMPAIFCLVTFIIKFFLENDFSDTKLKFRKKILILVMIIGACTPLGHIARGIYRNALYHAGFYIEAKIPWFVASHKIIERICYNADIYDEEGREKVENTLNKIAAKIVARIKKSKVDESIYSFGRIATTDEGLINLVKNQFFMYDYESRPFYKYIGKRPE